MDTSSPGSNSRNTDLARAYGSNWTKANVSTLFEWLCIASFKIKCLDFAIKHYRWIIRNNTIYGLIVATLTGTISVGKFGIPPNDILTNNIINGVFAVLSFTIAIFSGYLKVYQIQEQLEECIKLKQDWIVFSTAIASELQLPIELRRDALWIIIKNKTVYLNLLKTDIEVPQNISNAALKDMPHSQNLKLNVSTLSNIIFDIGVQELEDIQSEGCPKDRISNAVKQTLESITVGKERRNSIIKASLSEKAKKAIAATEQPSELSFLEETKSEIPPIRSEHPSPKNVILEIHP